MKYKVAVRCFTFNHSNFIVEAMNGFTMQNTSFPYVCCIVDDHSPDNTPQVIADYVDRYFETPVEMGCYKKQQEYGLVHFCQHKRNTNCFFAIIYLNENHYSIKKPKLPYLDEWNDASEYISLCEGDDYWISPDKLEKQVAFLDANPDYSMCFHNAFKLIKRYDAVPISSVFNEFEIDTDFTVKDAIDKWNVPTPSIVYRKSVYHYPDWMANIYSGDYSLVLALFLYGKIRYIHGYYAIYRYNVSKKSTSMSSTINPIFIKTEQTRLLESYNKGTNYQFNEIISKKIKQLHDETVFMKMKTNKNPFLVFTILPFVINKYYKLFKKILTRVLHR